MAGIGGVRASARESGLRAVLRDQTWVLVAIGTVEALLAVLLGFAPAAQGILTGMPVGLLNHWVARLSMRRWGRGGAGAAWIMGGSSLRLVLAGGLLWWSSSRGVLFLVGTLIGLLVEVAGYMVAMPRLWSRRNRADGRTLPKARGGDG